MEKNPEVVFRALADPTRRALFERLCAGGEQTVGTLTGQAGVSQPAVSKHLAVLKEAGLVKESAYGLESVVAWTMDAAALGTRLHMEQTGFCPDQEQAYQGAQMGWPRFFDELGQVLARD
ncbi:ArsR/SmtB family transcription factor [Duganella callida]|uniref:Metalloregulator ArsR/SmtB family transcription factor n=1 Tax=Duganella callida TaxID=2561932 RepID=A0A4Y9SZJ5_9BURK|nr:metalloregulator ArsR/SmtB family transcription factor [Duganella callida]TFW30166.1 metalloregulator ArsR/SmtB family transcription factor [Duganella callida]